MPETSPNTAREPEWSVELPTAWQAAPFWPERVKVVATAALPRGREALLVNAMLRDGTCVIALTWDRGRRLARCGPANDWGIEERFLGKPPAADEQVLLRLWKIAVNAQLEAVRQAEAELGKPPVSDGGRDA